RAAATPDPALRLTPARRRVLETLGDGPPRPAAELARQAGVGTGVVRGLVEAGVLSTVMLAPLDDLPAPEPDRDGPALSPDQAGAADALRGRLDAGFSVTLIDGVTGSGKTEVYFEAVAE